MAQYGIAADSHLSPTASAPRTRTVSAALAAIALGAVMIFGVGFAHSSVLHNAAHDTRHAIGFPCH